LPQRVAQLADERRKLERELAMRGARWRSRSRAQRRAGAMARDIGGIKVVFACRRRRVAAKDLKGLADDAKAKIGSGVVAFVAVADGKGSLVVGVTDDLKERASAPSISCASAPKRWAAKAAAAAPTWRKPAAPTMESFGGSARRSYGRQNTQILLPVGSRKYAP
jgi:alanyl-tRNA synthetase